MRPWTLRPLLACLALSAVLGCGLPPQTAPEVAAPAGGQPASTAIQQQMATLAFVAYLGEELTGSDDKVEGELYPCLVDQLAAEPLTAGKWTLAWGPAVYKFDIAHYDDNMLYVVRDAANPARLAIATRGTNAEAILDWLLEDLDVEHQVAWRYGDAPSGAKISQATENGLRVLQTMSPASGPVPNQTLTQFLKAYSQGNGPLEIHVTGHSLGGALAPTLALWLADTRSDWDASGQSTIAVVSLAGPTAGNAAFAAYSDSRIGASTTRLHNPYDVVPLAWNHATMGTIAGLYAPQIEPEKDIRDAIDIARDLVRDKGYAQIRPDVPALPGALFAGTSYVDQVVAQHTCGYQCALGLVPGYTPVSLDCQPGQDQEKTCSCPPATPAP
jgi:Lipase (class 3)